MAKLYDVCTDGDRWITVEAPVKCSVGRILKELSLAGIPIKGKTVSKLTEDGGEVAVRLLQ